jgi:hypothetical protein
LKEGMSHWIGGKMENRIGEDYIGGIENTVSKQ